MEGNEGDNDEEKKRWKIKGVMEIDGEGKAEKEN